MKKSIVKLTVVATLGIGVVVTQAPNTIAFANSLNELNQEKKEIENKQNNVETKLTDKHEEISDVKDQQSNVKAEIARLNTAISSTQVKIIEKKEQVSTTKAEIKKLEAQIKEVKERIEKRNELLKDRARSYQETGGAVSYIDVLMGSQSFSDFIDRMGAVATILEADQDILREQEADKKLLEQSQAELKTKLSSLEKMLSDLENMKSSLNGQKKEKDNLMAKLKKEENHIHAEMLSLEEEEAILADQKVAMEKAIQLEKVRIAEAARRAELARKAELERKRKAAAAAAAEAAAKANSTSDSSSSSDTDTSSGTESSYTETVPAPAVSAGSFTRPASGYISSGLGMRWGSFHAGVDIAASGTVPVVAAADGVVIRSYTSSSYGEVIFVSHYIDGQVYTTVYAHLQSGSRAVGTGQVVHKGQQIGLMGNTGESFGQHLHFELHKGEWNAAKSNAINPIGIVPM
ncbi:murein hydrolase activator EnvC family protein [Niallia sp. 01092]|uniref:murein hydrolase activator EnvC family protein n=1 Tax=unclassified Niallia TaxID=2837522 RepID=UPI003FD59CA4